MSSCKMNQDNIFANLKKDVRSLLISSKMGLNPDQLRRDYNTMLGHPLPLKLLGFRNVMDMVNNMPDVVSVNFREDSGIFLKAVSDESTRNIEQLVAKQRTSNADKRRKEKKFSSHRSFYQPSSVILPRRGSAPLALPPELRAKLRLLLSQGPLRLSELDNCFLQCFGYPLRVHDYGFYSNGEMLQVADDLVLFQHSRFGSILSLKDQMLPKPLLRTYCAQLSPGAGKMVTPAANTRVPIPTKSQVDVPSHVPGNSAHSESTNSICKLQVIENNQESQPEPCQKSLFHQHALKLEDEFRQQIVENGIAGTVNHELKEKLLKVVSQRDCGLSVHNLPEEYKRLFGVDLPLKENGFVSVTELVDTLGDIFHLQPAESDGRHHWIIKNIQDGGLSHSGQHDGINQPHGCHLRESLWEGKVEDDDHILSVDQVKEPLTSNHFMNQERMSGMCPAVKVYCSSTVPLDALQGQHLKQPTQYATRVLLQVRVEQVESPGLFYIHFSESEETQAFEDMMVEMRRCYSSPEIFDRYRLPKQFVRQGQVCCVSSKYMFFYRGVIHQVFSPTSVEVYLVDIGNMITVNTANLKFLKSSFSAVPAQAVPSSLAGIKPTNGDWTSEATASFVKLCSNRTLVAALNCYTGDVLQLYLCDTHTDKDIYIHQILMSQGYGVACSPSASAALCVQVTPVSLYLGEGTFDLPDVEEETTCSLQPAEKLEQSSMAALKLEAEELPALEFIEDSGLSVDIQNTSLTRKEEEQALIVTEASTLALPHALKMLEQHQDCSFQGMFVKQEPRLGWGASLLPRPVGLRWK
ncbi:tudor domain-containing protein 5-like isoform X2 [Dunckerocampus dactyliophorus]|uniref:tudor domain-containing protein 5-like isoform X2 n=1 Tax=Dunckerocampus dactyliophorus TaxID=161453 RepID=UPI002405AA1B|nr:tudor domain-containing protein 5-like isoform X2 [Dunckerocampus dactyliophorus]